MIRILVGAHETKMGAGIGLIAITLSYKNEKKEKRKMPNRNK